MAIAPRSTRPFGFLPLALIETYLRAQEPRGHNALRTEIAPLTRVCRIAVAHWLIRRCGGAGRAARLEGAD
jgi:hypothetical protein